MASLRVEQMIHQIEEMTPEEQEVLQNALDRLLAGRPIAPTPLEQALMEDGLLRHPARADRRLAFFRNWKPIEIEGEPISKTIIEERR